MDKINAVSIIYLLHRRKFNAKFDEDVLEEVQEHRDGSLPVDTLHGKKVF